MVSRGQHDRVKTVTGPSLSITELPEVGDGRRVCSPVGAWRVSSCPLMESVRFDRRHLRLHSALACHSGGAAGGVFRYFPKFQKLNSTSSRGVEFVPKYVCSNATEDLTWTYFYNSEDQSQGQTNPSAAFIPSVNKLGPRPFSTVEPIFFELRETQTRIATRFPSPNQKPANLYQHHPRRRPPAPQPRNQTLVPPPPRTKDPETHRAPVPRSASHRNPPPQPQHTPSSTSKRANNHHHALNNHNPRIPPL